MTEQRRILSFLGLAFGFSWAIAGVGALLKVDVKHPAYVALAAAYMLGPALAALVMWKAIDREPWSRLGLHPRLVRWRGMLLTVLIGIAIVPAVLAVITVLGEGLGLSTFGQADVSSGRFTTSLTGLLESRGVKSPGTMAEELAGMPGAAILGVMLISAVFSAFTVNLPFMLGEELGWRGYLYKATGAWSPASRIALTGPLWGIWHAPLILMGHNYPGYPLLGIGMMVVFCTLLSVLFDHARLRVNSVWGACILHGIINGSAGAFGLFAWGGHALVASPAGLAGAIAIFMLTIVVFLIDGDYRTAFFRVSAPDLRS